MITSCKNCVFAKFSKNNNQIGCKVGRLKKFIKSGEAIASTKIEKESIFSEKQKEGYYFITRLCNYARSKEWAKRKKNLEEEVKKECNIKCTAIIHHRQNISLLKNIVQSCINQKLKPCLMVVLNENIGHKDQISDFFVNELEKSGIQWWCHNIINSEQNAFEYINALMVRKIICGQYYIYINDVIPNTTLLDIDYFINESLKQFMAIKPNSSGNGLVVPTKAHIYFNGHHNKPIWQKIPDPSFIFEINKVCSQFPI